MYVICYRILILKANQPFISNPDELLDLGRGPMAIVYISHCCSNSLIECLEFLAHVNIWRHWLFHPGWEGGLKERKGELKFLMIIKYIITSRARASRPAGTKVALRFCVCLCVCSSAIITCAKLCHSVTMPL